MVDWIAIQSQMPNTCWYSVLVLVWGVLELFHTSSEERLDDGGMCFIAVPSIEQYEYSGCLVVGPENRGTPFKNFHMVRKGFLIFNGLITGQ